MSIRLVRAALLPMLAALTAGAAVSADNAKNAGYQSIRIRPEAMFLTDGRDAQRILVTAECADGSTRDVTSQASLVIARADLVRLDADEVLPLADGTTTLLARFAIACTPA